jgi:hypothetical protein
LSSIEWISYILQDWLQDGSHTPAKNGGEAVGYQGRKASNTTNALCVSDNQGVMLAMSTPQAGQHPDLYQIQALFEEICLLLKEAGITLKGLFLNADPGFDSTDFHKACQTEEIIANVKPTPSNQANQQAQAYQTGTHLFDDELYPDRSVVDHRIYSGIHLSTLMLGWTD